MPCVVLWRPEALDCRMLTWNGFTPPIRIRTPDLLHLRADPLRLDYRDPSMHHALALRVLASSRLEADGQPDAGSYLTLPL